MSKLLHVRSRSLHEFDLLNPPPFALLFNTSECPGGAGPERKYSAPDKYQPLTLPENILSACKKVEALGLEYVWVEHLCVDKASSVEVEQTVNNRFDWFARSEICIIHLHDLAAGGPASGEGFWKSCSYWSKSQMIQELIAPSRVEFFDENWQYRGSTSSPVLLPLLANITSIERSVLLNRDAVSRFSVAERMTWAAGKKSELEEDVAYSLVGLFGVKMPVRYGEGAERAFQRLQEEILRDSQDGSIFAWRSIDDHACRGLLARSPNEFRHFTSAEASDWKGPWIFDGKISLTSRGIEVQSRFSRHGLYAVMEIGRVARAPDKRAGIYLRKCGGFFVRVHSGSLIHLENAGVDYSVFMAPGIDFQSPPLIKSEEQTALRLQDCARTSDTTRDSTGSENGSDKNEFVISLPIRTVAEDASSLHGHDVGDDKVAHLQTRIFPVDTCTGHANHDIQRGLSQFAYQRFQQWSAMARHVTPLTALRSPSMGLEMRDDVDEDLVVISRVDGHLHFACPFYANDSVRYRDCIRKDDLRSVDEVWRHLRQHHTHLAYCPICSQVFREVMESGAKGDHRGDQETDESKVSRRAGAVNGNDSEAEEEAIWQRLYGILFSTLEPCRSAYLDEGCGLEISQARDFWFRDGRQCISEYLLIHAGCHIEQVGGELVVKALHSAVLTDLIGSVLEDYSRDKEESE